MELLFAFLQRVLSGLTSFFGYKKSEPGLVLMTCIMCFFPFIHLGSRYVHPVLLIIFLIVNAITVIMKSNSFKLWHTIFEKWGDIHLWENLVTGGYFVLLCISGYNIILICASVYPALIVHKGLINLGSNQSFFDSATDDKTGKTYGIPLLGIKIKRSSTGTRIVLAILSTIVAVVALEKGWAWAIHL